MPVKYKVLSEQGVRVPFAIHAFGEEFETVGEDSGYYCQVEELLKQGKIAVVSEQKAPVAPKGLHKKEQE